MLFIWLLNWIISSIVKVSSLCFFDDLWFSDDLELEEGLDGEETSPSFGDVQIFLLGDSTTHLDGLSTVLSIELEPLKIVH